MEQQTQTTAAVAERVEEQRRDRGVTVVWLCETTGIPRATMNRRLNGATPFNLNELDRIATALRVSVAALLGPVLEDAS